MVAKVVEGDADIYTVRATGKQALMAENNSQNQLLNQRYGYINFQIWHIWVNLILFMHYAYNSL